MVVDKKTKKGKGHKNRTKEGQRTGVRTSGKTNSPPGYPNLQRAGSEGGERHIKRGAKIELGSLFAPFGSACPHASRMYFPEFAR